MDVNSPVIHGGSAQPQSAVRAQTLATSTSMLSSDQSVNALQNAPNVSNSRSYSPALYAQAAQLQLYTQAGTLAALLGAHGPSNADANSGHDESGEIAPVEKVESTHIDTHA